MDTPESRTVRLKCKREGCPVEVVAVMFTIWQKSFEATGDGKSSCPGCGGRLVDVDQFPLADEQVDDLLRGLDKA